MAAAGGSEAEAAEYARFLADEAARAAAQEVSEAARQCAANGSGATRAHTQRNKRHCSWYLCINVTETRSLAGCLLTDGRWVQFVCDPASCVSAAAEAVRASGQPAGRARNSAAWQHKACV